MGVPAAGTVVVIPFPFPDLSRSKLRPAAVLAAADRDDLILCQVTSKPYSDDSAIPLAVAGFQSGSLQRTSYARPSKLFTANTALVLDEIGVLRDAAREAIIDAVVAIPRGGRRRVRFRIAADNGVERSGLALRSLVERVAPAAHAERQR